MPSKGYILAPANFQISSAPLITFLYQTRTLQSRFLPQHHYILPNPHQSCRNFSSTSRHQICASRASTRDAIPFEGETLPRKAPHAKSRPRKPLPEPHNDLLALSENSTLTTREKSVFDRILKDLSLSRVKKSEDEHKIMDVDLDAEYGDSDRDITEIFDQAIENLKIRENRRAEIMLKNGSGEAASRLHHMGSLNLPLIPNFTSSHLQLSTSKAEPKNRPGVDDELMRAECKQHRHNLIRLLKSANSDIQIWKILELEVFSMIEILITRINEEEQGEADLRQPTPIGIAKLINRRKKNAKKLSAYKPIPFAPESLLYILQHNYGDYCLIALRLLRKDFPSSTYALHLLPTIKRLGSISYVLGASSGLYNELLLLKWTQYTDLQGMADLLEEMESRGVERNEVTLAVLKAVGGERKRWIAEPVESTRSNHVLHVWWRLATVQDAWRRLEDGLIRAQLYVKKVRELERQAEEDQQRLDDDDEDDEEVNRDEEGEGETLTEGSDGKTGDRGKQESVGAAFA